MTKASLLLGLVLAAAGFGAPARAAEQPEPPRVAWSFAGAFGTFDRAQIQRGFKIYREVCAACHGLSMVALRTLEQPGGPQFSEAQVKALAADYKVKDGPNDAGEMFERPGRPSDYFPNPFPNPQAAAAANNGKTPPDLSVVAKARTYERGFPRFIFDALPLLSYAEQGPDYIHALLTGYADPPADFKLPEGGNYNTFFPGHVIAMPKPLNDGQVDYKGPDGQPQVPETIDQYAKDVAAFLMWAAEPHLEARKAMGFEVVIYLLVFAGLVYVVKKRIWARAGGENFNEGPAPKLL